MKTVYITLMIVIMTFIFRSTQAGNEYQDTLRLNMSNNVVIEQLTSYRTPGDAAIFNTFKTYLKDFLTEFDKIETHGLSEDHPMKISFIKAYDGWTPQRKKIAFKDYQPTTTVTLVENINSLMIDKRIHILELRSGIKQLPYTAFVHFSTIEQLHQLLDYDYDKIDKDLVTIFADSSQYSHLKHKPFTSWIEVDNNSHPNLIYNEIPSHPNDVIQLTAGTGLQSLKGQWQGSFNTQMTIILSRKMVDKHALSVAYEWLYNFTSPNEKFVNQFIDFGYAYNLSSIPNKDKWLELNFGFLTKRKGEFFDKNTYRLGLNSKVSKNFSVGPQIYFNDFFDNVYPGVNIALTVL